MRQRKNRTLIIAALVIALASTTVAYAVLQTTLNISGTITRTGGTWGVTLKNLNCTATGQSVVNATTTNGINLSFTGTFATIGDVISCTYDLENTGTVTAYSSMNTKLNGYTGVDPTGTGYISWENNFTYADPSEAGVSAGYQTVLIKDEYTKCYLTHNGQMITGGSATALSWIGHSPYSSIGAGRTITGLGIECQYFNLTEENTQFKVELVLDYTAMK